MDNEWHLESYKYEYPFFEREWGRDHNNPNYHYGYDDFPTYRGLPLAAYEQLYRAEQARIPMHARCQCSGMVQLKSLDKYTHDAVCDKCHKHYGRFTGARGDATIDERVNAMLGKEKLENISSANVETLSNLPAISENQLMIVLTFIFVILLACMYTHVHCLKMELKAIKKMQEANRI